MLEAVVAGARDPELATCGISVEVCPALAANVPDVLAADGFVLGTPVNIGYMSGALKHFFDQVYYPCLGAKAGAPYGLYVHGDNNTAGAVRAVKSIATGLGWSEVVNPVTAVGPAGKDTERQCYELGATVAANLALSGRPHGRSRRDAPVRTMGRHGQAGTDRKDKRERGDSRWRQPVIWGRWLGRPGGR
jgi:multimeric flavodoxin WrbA